MAFPTAAVYSKALATLIGEEMPLREDSASPDVREGVFYMTELLGDDDEVIGAMVADLAATVFQGGTLMMLGPEAIQEMARDKDPSEDVVETMKEVLNVQSRCFNEVKDNPHIRIGEFRLVEPSDDWLWAPAHRLTFVDSFGGRTLLLSK